MGSTEEQVAQFDEQWNSSYGYLGTDPFLNEAPQMLVWVDTYAIDQNKVTYAQYRRCVENGVCVSLPDWPNPQIRMDDPSYPDYPAQVDWMAANTYCQWVAKRLPTEAEWEKAARGVDGRWYPWGNTHNLTYYNSSQDEYQPVGHYPLGASPFDVFGTLDQPGEWTLDVYRAYPGNAAIYPSVDTSGGRGQSRYDQGYHVARGGGLPEAERARVTVRSAPDNSIRMSFRCVRGPAPTSLAQTVRQTSAPTSVPTLVPSAAVDLSSMVYVPAGEFIMGGYSRAEESPPHVVDLQAFYIDRTVVTREQWVVFLNALGTERLACDGHHCGFGGSTFLESLGRYALAVYDPVRGELVESDVHADLPAYWVSWYGARSYCAWLGKRMPTEAEWEKAARGTDARRFPWGNDVLGNELMGGGMYAVGSRPNNSSPYGMYDVFNAAEWVADWYAPNYYSFSPHANPLGPTYGADKVIRGPDTDYALQEGRQDVILRLHHHPERSDAGFRCAYSAAQ